MGPDAGIHPHCPYRRRWIAVHHVLSKTGWTMTASGGVPCRKDRTLGMVLPFGSPSVAFADLVLLSVNCNPWRLGAICPSWRLTVWARGRTGINSAEDDSSSSGRP